MITLWTLRREPTIEQYNHYESYADMNLICLQDIAPELHSKLFLHRSKRNNKLLIKQALHLLKICLSYQVATVILDAKTQAFNAAFNTVVKTEFAQGHITHMPGIQTV